MKKNHLLLALCFTVCPLVLFTVYVFQDDFIKIIKNGHAAWIVIGLVLTSIVMGIIVVSAKSQSSLRKSERVLQAAISNISQGLLVVDKSRKMPVINNRAIELLSIPDYLAVPNANFDQLREWQLNSGEFDNPTDQQVRDFVEQGGINQGVSIYYRTRKDGTILEVRTKTLDEGLAVRTFTDITSQKNAEKNLMSAKEAAESATHARETFLAVMSHEIRTPLNGMLGMSDILLDMELPAEARGYIQIIKQSGDHLLQLLNDILDFSKLNADQIELEHISFDPKEVFLSTIKILNASAALKNLELKVTFNDSASVQGDPGRLRQIIFNLVGNAIKFTNQGSVVCNGRIDWIDENPKLYFEIADTGIGIEPEALKTLFSEFTQADSSISRRFGGTGLGLAISKRLIEKMNGGIKVESTPGSGSRFMVEIPCLKAEIALVEVKPEQKIPCLNVLLAEDNPTNRLVATRMLEKLGHTVHSVENGALALEAVQNNRFDLILMDMMMPVMDGIQSTREIRCLDCDQKNTPIVGLTANSTSEDRNACLQAGMNGFVTKPVVLKTLITIINSVLASDQQISDEKPTQNSHQILDKQRLEELIKDMGYETVSEIVDIFREDIGEKLAVLDQALAAQDMSKLFKEAHSLSGAAKNVGLTYLGMLADQLQNQGSDIKSAELEDFIGLIKQQANLSTIELQQWLAHSKAN